MKFSIVLLSNFIGFLTVFAQSQPVGLLCNLLSHPEQTVITVRPISFGWEVPLGKQASYRILVSSTAEKAAQHEGDVWDSGRIRSRQSIHVEYKGKALQPNRQYWWQVSLWNEAGQQSDWSVTQQFNTGDWDRVRLWPGESRWVRIAMANGDSIWSFEDRHPISYHAVTPVRTVKRSSGTLFFDFGRAAFAYARFTLNSPADRETIIRIGEKAAGDSIDCKPGGGIIFKEYPISLKQGTHDYELTIPPFVPRYEHSQSMPAHMPEIVPFRYLELVAGDMPVTVQNMEQLALYYLFDDNASSFRSSNETLNDIYDLCKYSVKANTFNGDFAASERERMLYEADSYIHQLGVYAIDREYAIARYSNVNMIYHGTIPTEWILHIPLMVWADYEQTGDLSFIARYYDEIKPKSLLDLTNDNGLISTLTGLQSQDLYDRIHFDVSKLHNQKLIDYVDWPWGSMSLALKDKGGETDNYDFREYNAVVNAFHYRTLVLIEQMAVLLGKKDDASFYRQKAKQVKAAFNKHFLDPESGIYVDGVGISHASFHANHNYPMDNSKDSTVSSHSSLHANMYPLLFGLVPDKNKSAVVNFIKSRGMACGPYGANHLLEALYNAGEAEYALSLLTSDNDRSWVNMLRVGATMSTEAWDNKYKSNNGWSHAWSSSPAHIIPRKLMGIEPLEAGFGKIRIQPQPSSVKQASAKLPTIRGPVEVSFEQEPGQFFDMHVTVPGNVIAEIWLPLLSPKYTLTVDGKPVKGKVDGKYIKVTMTKNNERIRICH